MFPDSVRETKVIRLCDREEAAIMIEDGSFADLLNQYRRRYHHDDSFIRSISNTKFSHSFHSLSLREAKYISETRFPHLIFQIGNDIRLYHTSHGQYNVYRKINGVWEIISHSMPVGAQLSTILLDKSPIEPKRERTPIKFGEF